MAVAPPAQPGSPSRRTPVGHRADPDALIEEARARQRARRLRLIGAGLVLAALGGGIYGAFGGAAGEPPTIPAIGHSLAAALSHAQKTLILRVQKQRTNTPELVSAVEWVDLSNGQQNIIWHNASGHVTQHRLRASYCEGVAEQNDCNLPPPPNSACGCDLDPFTNFPGVKPRISLIGRQTINHQPTFHLRFIVPRTRLIPSTITDLWISQSTQLPVEETVSFPATYVARHPKIRTTNHFTWLPRTRTNLAHLEAVTPHG